MSELALPAIPTTPREQWLEKRVGHLTGALTLAIAAIRSPKEEHVQLLKWITETLRDNKMPKTIDITEAKDPTMIGKQTP